MDDLAVVTDTSFIIDVAQRDGAALDKLQALSEQRERIVAPTIVAVEFLEYTADPRAALGDLERGVGFSPFEIDDAVCAAQIARELRDRGQYPGRADCMIAGFARARGDLPILTRNVKHFPASRIAEY